MKIEYAILKLNSKLSKPNFGEFYVISCRISDQLYDSIRQDAFGG